MKYPIGLNKLCIFFYIMYLFCNSTYANWLCRTTSSVVTGEKTILTCGVADSSSLQEARTKSFEEAKREFQRICNMNQFCLTNLTRVSPLRTDCEKVENRYTCYRGLEFRITDTPKKNIEVDIELIRFELQEKKVELERLHAELQFLEDAERSVKEKNKLTKKIEIIKNRLFKKEAEIIPIQDKISSNSISQNAYNYKTIKELYTQSVFFSISYEKVKFNNISENIYSFNLGHEYRALNWLGLGLSTGWGSDFIKEESQPTGNPSSTATTNEALKTFKYGFFSSVYLLQPFYLKAEIGQIKASRVNVTTEYGPLGTKVYSVESKHKESNTYYGLSAGWDSRGLDLEGIGGYGELGVRIFDNEVTPILSIGVNFGF